jgi:hypothetical protein
MYSAPSSTPHEFTIGIIHLTDNLKDGLFNITVGLPLTATQLEQIRNLFDEYVIDILPDTVDVSTLLTKIHSVLGEGATIERTSNIAYYGDSAFGAGWTHIHPLYTIYHDDNYFHYQDTGSISTLQRFLKAVNVCL